MGTPTSDVVTYVTTTQFSRYISYSRTYQENELEHIKGMWTVLGNVAVAFAVLAVQVLN